MSPEPGTPTCVSKHTCPRCVQDREWVAWHVWLRVSVPLTCAVGNRSVGVGLLLPG